MCVCVSIQKCCHTNIQKEEEKYATAYCWQRRRPPRLIAVCYCCYCKFDAPCCSGPQQRRTRRRRRNASLPAHSQQQLELKCNCKRSAPCVVWLGGGVRWSAIIVARICTFCCYSVVHTDVSGSHE